MEDNVVVLESARQHLKKLAPIARQLNQATDDFTDELRAIEEELGKLKVGVEVTFGQPLERGELRGEFHEVDESTDVFRMNVYLGYGRLPSSGPIRSTWGLLARVFCDYEDKGGEVVREVFVRETPLLESSREIRMAAAGQINDLLQVMTNVASEKLASISKAIDKK